MELAYSVYHVYSTRLFRPRFSSEAAKPEDPYSGIFNIEPANLSGDATSAGSYIDGTGKVADSMEINFFILAVGHQITFLQTIFSKPTS